MTRRPPAQAAFSDPLPTIAYLRALDIRVAPRFGRRPLCQFSVVSRTSHDLRPLWCLRKQQESTSSAPDLLSCPLFWAPVSVPSHTELPLYVHSSMYLSRSHFSAAHPILGVTGGHGSEVNAPQAQHFCVWMT